MPASTRSPCCAISSTNIARQGCCRARHKPGPEFRKTRNIATIGLNLRVHRGNSRSISRRRPMKTSFKWHLAVLAVGLAVPTAAFSLEGGTREVPAKEILVPTADVSVQEQSLIGAPLPPFWNDHPKDAVVEAA